MPSMANITVKKADGTTDVVFVAASPSAGDSSPAVWRQNAASNIIGHRPKVNLLVRDNAAKTGRVFQSAMTFPITHTDGDGKVTLLATVPLRFEGTLPAGVADTAIEEAVEQYGNLIVSDLFRAALKEQYAPT